MKNPLGTVIAAKFPDASSITDFNIEDQSDGKGPQITLWNEAKLGPKPTKKELESWDAEFAGLPFKGLVRKEAIAGHQGTKDLLAVIDRMSPDEIAEFVAANGANMQALRALMVKVLLVLASR